MLVLFTDTDTDLTPEEAIYYGYKMISMPYKGKIIPTTFITEIYW